MAAVVVVVVVVLAAAMAMVVAMVVLVLLLLLLLLDHHSNPTHLKSSQCQVPRIQNPGACYKDGKDAYLTMYRLTLGYDMDLIMPNLALKVTFESGVKRVASLLEKKLTYMMHASSKD